MLARVTKVTVLGGYRIRLEFADGFVREIDLDPYLSGPVFEPVREPKYFRRVRVECGTIVWPNDADICPDTLYHAIPPDKLDDMAYLRKIPGLLSDRVVPKRRGTRRARRAAAKGGSRKVKPTRALKRRRRNSKPS
ncbi:MAG: DUF2442 domain-containing protein [Planctomycetes bacterium]|nr:DUF2442 domain-containing protein [Planctomycetota bacterium]MBI3846551.1 DUF2442 domain-containing protein [Planctomycetota bacterium]